jgi:glucose-6-phosphate 1-dehydrogenase
MGIVDHYLVKSMSKTIVIFGATGDLALKKIFPALARLYANKHISSAISIMAISRSALTTQSFQATLKNDFGLSDLFVSRITYYQGDCQEPTIYTQLAALKTPSYVFYMAIAPHLFIPTTSQLAAAGLNKPPHRLVIEKPIGHNLSSAMAIHAHLAQHFSENQLYRMDHYLGKETVQNIQVLRFSNFLFESLWDRRAISSIQITVAESVSVQGREDYYNNTGALRDMVQNHLLQLLCLVTMEPPSNNSVQALRTEKNRVLKSLASINLKKFDQNIVMGQYEGYQNSPLTQNSLTETYVALRCYVQNWRWADVPFYLRTGKAMARKTSEIIVNFYGVPNRILPSTDLIPNQLIIQLQPDEGIKLKIMTKKPGLSLVASPVYLDLPFSHVFPGSQLGAYERLLLDVIRGDQTLFMDRSAIESAWQWIDPVVSYYKGTAQKPIPYAQSSWGPIKAANDLLSQDQNQWYIHDS